MEAVAAQPDHDQAIAAGITAILATTFVAHRTQALADLIARVAGQLGQLVYSYRTGKAALPTTVDDAVRELTAGYRAAMDAGATHAAQDHSDIAHPDYTDAAEQAAEAQRGHVMRLIKDALTRTSPQQLAARLDQFADTLSGAYNAGYGQAVQQAHPDYEIVWHLGQAEHCKLCLARDGKVYTPETLPGYPGSGGFGGHVCEGGPRCKCWLEYRPATVNKSPGALGSTVYDYLSQVYPADTLDWVQQADWRLDTVPLADIDMDRRPGGRDPKKVEGIAAAIQAGKEMDPVVLVDTGNPRGLQIADGYHRTLAFRHAGRTAIAAYVASGVGEHGSWDREMHDRKLNKIKKLEKSPKTPMYSVTHAPLGVEGLWHYDGLQLPAYIQNVARGVMESGHTREEAIPIAINALKHWAAGRGHVHAEVRAAAAKAIGEWDALKASHHKGKR